MSLSEMANPNMSSDPEIAGFITKTYEILCVWLSFYVESWIQ